MQYIYLSSPNENKSVRRVKKWNLHDEPGFQSLQRVSQLGRKFYITIYLYIIIKQLLINYFVLPKGETVQIDYFVYVRILMMIFFLNCIKAPLTRDWWIRNCAQICARFILVFSSHGTRETKLIIYTGMGVREGKN